MRQPITRWLGIMLLLSLSLQGCGHKAPLYLPGAPPAGQSYSQSR